MAQVYLVKESNEIATFLVFTFVILLVSLIHLLSRDPPEQYIHTFRTDNSKLQYITIGQAPTQVRHGQND